MSKAQRDKGKRGERRWAAWLQCLGLLVKSTVETGNVGHDEEIGADLALVDFNPPLRFQCKEMARNCPSPRAMLERAHIVGVHFTEGSWATRDVLIMRADVFAELARKVAKGAEV